MLFSLKKIISILFQEEQHGSSNSFYFYRCDSSIQPELISFLSGGWKVMVIG
jgi:hypothetical protein